MKRNLMNLATVAVLAAGMAMAQTTTPAPAQHAQRPFRAAIHQRMMQALNLTDAQKLQAKTLFQQTRTEIQPLEQQVRQNRQAMAQAIKSDDEAAIRQLSKTQSDVRSQILADHNIAAAQFYKMLTPEQRAKADQMRQNMRQRIEQRRAQQHTNG